MLIFVCFSVGIVFMYIHKKIYIINFFVYVCAFFFSYIKWQHSDSTIFFLLYKNVNIIKHVLLTYRRVLYVVSTFLYLSKFFFYLPLLLLRFSFTYIFFFVISESQSVNANDGYTIIATC